MWYSPVYFFRAHFHLLKKITIDIGNSFFFFRYPYVFGETFCVLRGLAAETSANATVLTITAFTVERYFAICHPFWSHSLSKLSRAIRLILVIWIISLLCAIPQVRIIPPVMTYGCPSFSSTGLSSGKNSTTPMN